MLLNANRRGFDVPSRGSRNVSRTQPDALEAAVNQPKTQDPERALRTVETADMLNVSKWKVRALVDEGALPALRVGRCLRFRRADVLAYMAANTATR